MNEDNWGEVEEQWMNKEIERKGRRLLQGTPQEVCCRYKRGAQPAAGTSRRVQSGRDPKPSKERREGGAAADQEQQPG